jgi:hydroxymethylbilane synthase
MTEKIRVGSRKSPLALAQTNLIIARLRTKHPNLDFELLEISTEGDEDYKEELGTPSRGKDAFTKKIEQRLIAQDIDLAVHSLKDLPTKLPDALTICSVPHREDPRDALVSVKKLRLRELPTGGRVGTSSLRRKVQLQAARPDLQVADLHGNIGTRIGRMQGNGLDGIILATAGLIRLGLEDQISEILDTQLMLPAIGQGALALEVRKNDSRMAEIARSIDDWETRLGTDAERAFSERLGGDCNLPVAAYGRVSDGKLTLEGMVGSLDGKRIIRERIVGEAKEGNQIGVLLAERMLARDALKMLAEST